MIVISISLYPIPNYITIMFIACLMLKIHENPINMSPVSPPRTSPTCPAQLGGSNATKKQSRRKAFGTGCLGLSP